MAPRRDFDSLSPLDYRYWREDVARYLSEEAFIGYKLLVESALVRVLCKRGICSESVAYEISVACDRVTAEEVYAEEDRIHYDIRALVNCIRRKVSDPAKPYVHMTATSYDIIDTAHAIRMRDVMNNVVIPKLKRLEKVLIDITLREADTLQIGRTHGQHAVPITFGFAMAEYVSRLGGCIENLDFRVCGLEGKFSGAVGSYAAASLFFDDPEEVEAEIMWELDVSAAEYSTQIVPPEAMIRLFSELTTTAGVLANLADDMRNLQRTEIGEVGEPFDSDQVGSSTMPQKRNPITFENAKSLWTVILPRLMTVFMNQISDHQRDLTNSASSRTYGESIVYLVWIAERLAGAMEKLVIDKKNLNRNLAMQGDMILAEPLYLILASLGHPDAHEKVKQLTLSAQRDGATLTSAAYEDPEMDPYLDRMTPYQKQIFLDPAFYVGIAPKRARAIAERWAQKFEI